MSPLYDALKTANPRGLLYRDAVQIFLWSFCTTSVLPQDLRGEALGKEELIEVFEALTADGLIHFEKHDLGSGNKPALRWADLVKSFLLKETALDESFGQRIDRFFNR